MEALTGSLGKLSKSMADSLISKTSTSATAFKALGISVTDSTGKMRDADDVFKEIATKFAMLEDGSTKTALAMQLFGKSGAALIPLLNTGGDEIQRMANEADRLGITLSTSTGRAAEQFNDTLALAGQILQGVVNKVMEAALPALQSLAQTIADPAFAEFASVVGVGLVNAVNAIANSFENAYNWAKSFIDLIKNTPVLGLNVGVNIGGVQIGPGETPANSSGSPDDRGGSSGGVASITVSGGKTETLDTPTFEAASKAVNTLDLGISDVTTGLTEMAKLGQQVGNTLADVFTDVATAFATGGDALKAFADDLANLGKQLLNQGLQAAFASLFGGVNIFGGATAGWAGGAGYMSFDGGGYTGSGSRSGGMDGKGGFLAMMHPDETVLDHTKGQGGQQISISITGSRQDAAAIANAVNDAIRQQMPGGVSSYNQNRYRRG